MSAKAAYQIGVVGAGAWGQALALTAQRAGRTTALWGRNLTESTMASLQLPAVAYAPTLADIAKAQVLLLVVPAQELRGFLPLLKPYVGTGHTIVLCAKGIERSTGLRLSQVVAELLPDCGVAVLSGPNFAHEVKAGLPAAATLACADMQLARQLAQQLSHAAFRCYPSDDVVGVELGGALKNVMSIASGILAGRALGENARAALLTRGLYEMMQLATRQGAQAETLMGLSGLGDLFLSASSAQSRNYSLGLALGQGSLKPDQMGSSLAEGRATALAVQQLAKAYQLDLPICTAVASILEGKSGIDEAIKSLMARPLKDKEI